MMTLLISLAVVFSVLNAILSIYNIRLAFKQDNPIRIMNGFIGAMCLGVGIYAGDLLLSVLL